MVDSCSSRRWRRRLSTFGNRFLSVVRSRVSTTANSPARLERWTPPSIVLLRWAHRRTRWSCMMSTNATRRPVRRWNESFVSCCTVKSEPSSLFVSCEHFCIIYFIYCVLFFCSIAQRFGETSVDRCRICNATLRFTARKQRWCETYGFWRFFFIFDFRVYLIEFASRLWSRIEFEERRI